MQTCGAVQIQFFGLQVLHTEHAQMTILESKLTKRLYAEKLYLNCSTNLVIALTDVFIVCLSKKNIYRTKLLSIVPIEIFNMQLHVKWSLWNGIRFGFGADPLSVTRRNQYQDP